ncbi:MAG: radical SAM protein [Spirochaetes bacterium]|nr:radical SAM protein [Spirochaetota bacterium]
MTAMESLTIDDLASGGIITNYYCSSKCAHCLYASSPQWEKRYMNPASAARIFRTIRSLGCDAVHIGGGEPFLNIPALEEILKTAHEEKVAIEYVETNSSWFHDEESATRTLLALKKHGLTTLLISISPFHNEYIPFRKVRGVIGACERADIMVFPWTRDFYKDLSALDDDKVHSLSEYAAKFGKNYLRDIPVRYPLNLRGRAIETYRTVFTLKPLAEILENRGCRELASTSHFHIDLFERYIPGLCSGFTIALDDLDEELDFREYPIITMMHTDGIGAFLDYAKREYGFIPEEAYLSKCHLCLAIRKFMVLEKNLRPAELSPHDYYRFL